MQDNSVWVLAPQPTGPIHRDGLMRAGPLPNLCANTTWLTAADKSIVPSPLEWCPIFFFSQNSQQEVQSDRKMLLGARWYGYTD